MSLWVKICAMTNPSDAAIAAEAGANAIGIIFAPSKRRVDLQRAREISRKAFTVERIGVFHDAPVDEIVEAFEYAELTGVQLHGNEPATWSGHLRRRLGDAARIIKSLQYSPDFAERADEYAMNGFDAVLLDSAAGNRGGGTGKRFDWKEAAAQRQPLNQRVKLVVAGGLNPENVGDAIAQLWPWGVDVVSGVEVEIGKKDPEKVRAFIRNARAATRPRLVKAERSRA